MEGRGGDKGMRERRFLKRRPSAVKVRVMERRRLGGGGYQGFLMPLKFPVLLV